MANIGKQMSDKLKEHNLHDVPTVVGIAWYKRDSYPRCLATFVDGASLHETFDEWLTAAEKVEKQLLQQGQKVVRVDIDPDTFPDWCAKNGFTQIDAKARTHYGNMRAAESLGVKPKNQ